MQKYKEVEKTFKKAKNEEKAKSSDLRQNFDFTLRQIFWKKRTRACVRELPARRNPSMGS